MVTNSIFGCGKRYGTVLVMVSVHRCGVLYRPNTKVVVVGGYIENMQLNTQCIYTTPAVLYGLITK